MASYGCGAIGELGMKNDHALNLSGQRQRETR